MQYSSRLSTVSIAFIFSIIPLSANAKNNFSIEILAGKADHQMSSYLEYLSDGHYYYKESSLQADSKAIRLNYHFNKNVQFELSYHWHGEGKAFTPISIPASTVVNGRQVWLSSEYDTEYQYPIHIDLRSVKVGLKGHYELLPSLNIFVSAGAAFWQHKEKTISSLHHGYIKSDYSPYYSAGANYYITGNLFAGVEASVFYIDENLQMRGADSNTPLHNIILAHQVTDVSLSLGWRF